MAGGERLTTLPSTAPSTQLGDGEPLTPDEAELAVMPEPLAPAKAVKFAIENGVITLDSDLPPNGVFYLVRLKGVPGHGKLQVSGGRFVTGARSVNLTHHSSANGQEITRQVFTTPGVNAIIAYSTPQFFSELTESMQTDPTQAGGTSVVLRVDTDPLGTGAGSSKIERKADTFVALRSQYPDDVDRYLRPLFRDLKQEAAVFAVDPKVAWQALSDSRPADPDLQMQVESVIAKLNADAFSDRKAAAAALAKLGQPAAMYLMKADRSKWSEEQTAQIDRFLSDFRAAPAADVNKLQSNVNFLLDCMMSSDPALRQAAADRLSVVTGRKISVDLAASGDDIAAKLAPLREQLAGGSTRPATAPAGQ